MLRIVNVVFFEEKKRETNEAYGLDKILITFPFECMCSYGSGRNHRSNEKENIDECMQA